MIGFAIQMEPVLYTSFLYLLCIIVTVWVTAGCPHLIPLVPLVGFFVVKEAYTPLIKMVMAMSLPIVITLVPILLMLHQVGLAGLAV